MKRLFGASLTIALAVVFGTSALAAELPEVKLSASNKVPQCATPGRLMAYLQSRNPRLDARFEGIATQYMRHGEALGIRWDIAFFQMILETGALRFGGDVRPAQNNFAGLGASGGGAHGESFADVSTGVKAHLQHLLMYAGDHLIQFQQRRLHDLLAAESEKLASFYFDEFRKNGMTVTSPVSDQLKSRGYIETQADTTARDTSDIVPDSLKR